MTRIVVIAATVIVLGATLAILSGCGTSKLQHREQRNADMAESVRQELETDDWGSANVVCATPHDLAFFCDVYLGDDMGNGASHAKFFVRVFQPLDDGTNAPDDWRARQVTANDRFPGVFTGYLF